MTYHQITDVQIARCRQWARANPNDPFAFGRAISDYRRGIAGRDGIEYECQFSKYWEEKVTGKGIIRIPKLQPINMKRP
jgi:hypothetical protein|tara:strand:+ start:2924 stop:3160 length:237 start_codon:yes stop_codon:yes gene_type:complete